MGRCVFGWFGGGWLGAGMQKPYLFFKRVRFLLLWGRRVLIPLSPPYKDGAFTCYASAPGLW